MTDDIDERLSQRFGEDDDGESDGAAPGGDGAPADASGSQASDDMNAQNAVKAQTAQNVKKEWNVRSFYLDDELDAELSTAFKRLDLELSEAGAAIDLKKTRHFYPLVVELGLEQLARMESTELMERLERTD